MTEKQWVLAGDAGGTNLKFAAVADDGTLLHRISVKTPRNHVAAELENAIATAAESCIAAISKGTRPKRFGLALAALVNSSQGKILSSPNLHELNELPLAEQLSETLGMEVVIENDATAAAIGEHWVGVSAGVATSIFITLGTGLGGGLIIDGRPYRGIDGTAGEVGHIVVEPDGHACGCGSHGCLEQYASATAVTRMARQSYAQEGVTSAEVFADAVAGNLDAVEIFRVMGRYLGIGLAGLVDVLNPEMIAVGGGVAGAWDLFSPSFRSEIDARAFRHPAERVQLVRASLGESAGLLGAAYLAFTPDR
jgi:glucokinase